MTKRSTKLNAANKSPEINQIFSFCAAANLMIFIKDEFTGFIGLDDCSVERDWSEDEINILQTLASNIASSLERIANEAEIKQSEEKFRLLANNIPGTVYL